MKIGVIYGPNETTPYGLAIPFHSSVRIKLSPGSAIKKTENGKENVIGISSTAKIVKNKMARPFREVSFEIHFGKGVSEHEQIFDELRGWCERNKTRLPTVGNKRVSINGTNTWKEMSITDIHTGEILEEVKFYKSDFHDKVLNKPEYKPYVDALMDACFIMRPEESDHTAAAGIDTSSADELEQQQEG